MNYSGAPKPFYAAHGAAAPAGPVALATGYTYTAPYHVAPPPPAHPQPYYCPAPPRPTNRRRRPVWFSIVLGVIILASSSSGSPRRHTFRPSPLPPRTVSSFSLGPTSSCPLSADFVVTLTLYNPNKKTIFRYDKVAVVVYYGGMGIANTALPPMYHGARTVTAHLVATAANVGDSVAGRIRSDRARGRGDVRFAVKVTSDVAFTVNGLNTKRRKVKVYCDDVVVWFDDAMAPSGKLVGPARPCRVK